MANQKSPTPDRNWGRGNPRNENILEKVFPQWKRKINAFNGIVGILSMVLAVIMVLCFLLSFFWPAFGTIAKISLVLGVILLAYRILMTGWGLYAWATESLGRAIFSTLALLGFAIVFFVLKWVTAGIVTLLIATIFATIYAVRNWTYIKSLGTKEEQQTTKKRRHTPHYTP